MEVYSMQRPTGIAAPSSRSISRNDPALDGCASIACGNAFILEPSERDTV